MRPRAWVEPQASWGAGSVLLVEIPTRDETFDNIVAFWKPEQPLEPGQEYLYAYTLTWRAEPPNRPTDLAIVRATRTGPCLIGSRTIRWSPSICVCN
ncbi:glucan biosynthesis protein [Marinobacter goseongensis]|uniref:glucan biosynthesis protein n=1 Tax=Marinobacter goseongensis TaxID=453838 RepID=UPI0031F3ABEC